MVTDDTIEGIVSNSLWFHYDFGNDVLYVRLVSQRDTPALGEEQPDGTILLRTEADDRLVGVTVVNWWRRFGSGCLPDSLSDIGKKVEAFAGHARGLIHRGKGKGHWQQSSTEEQVLRPCVSKGRPYASEGFEVWTMRERGLRRRGAIADERERGKK